jgi:hypothetical protein
MNSRRRYVPAFLGFVLVFVLCGLAQGGQTSGITVPPGTKLATLKYSDGGVVNLKPAEQVAFLFVYGIKDLEGTCASIFFGGPGRPCSMSELVSGVKTKGGQTVGLNQNPAQDLKYSYTLTIIGKHCVITATLKARAWEPLPGSAPPVGWAMVASITTPTGRT